MHNTVTSVQAPLAGNALNHELSITFIWKLFCTNANTVNLWELYLLSIKYQGRKKKIRSKAFCLWHKIENMAGSPGKVRLYSACTRFLRRLQPELPVPPIFCPPSKCYLSTSQWYAAELKTPQFPSTSELCMGVLCDSGEHRRPLLCPAASRPAAFWKCSNPWVN